MTLKGTPIEWHAAFQAGLDWDIDGMSPAEVVLKIRDEMAKLRYAHIEPDHAALNKSWPWLFP